MLTCRLTCRGALAAALALLVQPVAPARADTFTWRGTCSNGLWWSCCERLGKAYNNWHTDGIDGACPLPADRYPGLDDDVWIGLTDAVLVEEGTFTFVNLLSCEGLLRLTGRAFTVDSYADVPGQLLWDAGAIGGFGGDVSLFNVGGADASLLEIRTGACKELAGVMLIIDPPAKCLVSGSGDIMVNRSSSIHIAPGVEFEAQSDARVVANPFDGAGFFTNAGIIERTSSSGVFEFQIPVLNEGTVNVEAGTLRLKQGASSGAFVISEGAQLEIGNGADYTGSGEYHLAGAATSTGNGVLRIANGGILVLDESASAAAANVVLANGGIEGRIRGPGELNIGTSLLWTGGSMERGGTTRIQELAHGKLSGPDSKSLVLDYVLANAGTLTFASTGDLFFGLGARLDNLSTGLLDIASDADVRLSGGAGTINNAGWMRKSAGDGTTRIEAFVTNSGTLELLAGTLELWAGLTQTAGVTRLNGGTLTATGIIDIRGGALEGVGNVGGHVRNAGEVRPGLSAGVLTISVRYEQTAEGVLHVEIGGKAAGSEYDQLVVGWLAELDGTLRATLIDGFSPSVGDAFDVLLYELRTGKFRTLDLPDGFTIEYLSDRVRLTFEGAPCPADCTGDRRVGLGDLALLLSCYNSGTCCDIDGDGDTDLSDLAALLAVYGSDCP